MKKSRTVIRRRQSESPALRHLPLVDAQAELQELVVQSGLKVLEAMLEEDRVAVCGPRYAHPPRAACLAVLLLDGIHVGHHCIVVALGIDVTGQKHALGVWEGSTENTTVCQGLLTNLQSRGLRTERSVLVIRSVASRPGLPRAERFSSGPIRPGVAAGGGVTHRG